MVWRTHTHTHTQNTGKTSQRKLRLGQRLQGRPSLELASPEELSIGNTRAILNHPRSLPGLLFRTQARVSLLWGRGRGPHETRSIYYLRLLKRESTGTTSHFSAGARCGRTSKRQGSFPITRRKLASNGQQVTCKPSKKIQGLGVCFFADSPPK